MTRQEELTGLLSRYGDAYYDSDAPLVSDAEYDALYDELLQLEQESGFVLPGSPTRRVGANAGAFLPHTHIRRLYTECCHIFDVTACTEMSAFTT